MIAAIHPLCGDPALWYLKIMALDERTRLLAQQSPTRSAPYPEWNGKAAEPEEAPSRFGLWQIGALFGIMLAYANTSLVWATHETVASRFDTLRSSSWMMTSFTIGYCVTLPLYGRLSDNYGRLRPLIASYSIFSFGCTLCGVGQTYWQVVLGRIITGCGASGIISLASIVITDIAPPSDVAVLRSYVNVASSIGLASGGPVGGLLVGTFGWRWSFLGQVPIVAICCLLTARGLQKYLPHVKEEEEEEEEEEYEEEERDSINSEAAMKSPTMSFDYPGAIFLAIGMASFLTVIDLQSQLSWGHPVIIGTTSLCVLSVLAFFAFETWPGNRELLIPLRLLKTGVGAYCAGQLLTMGGCHGFISQIAPYFSNTQGLSDAQAGGHIAPSSFGSALGNLFAGQMIKRFGSYKKLSLTALFLSIATSLLILVQWSHPIGVLAGLAVFPFGFFGGIILSTQFIGLYNCASKPEMATAIGMYYMSQQIGIALGISCTSSLLKRQFQATLEQRLVGIPHYMEIIKKILTDSSVVAALPASVRLLVARCFMASFWVVPAFSIATQVFAVLPMALARERRAGDRGKSETEQVAVSGAGIDA
ncbi:uncharacterized protein L3040_007080 [Drepanopeziza brunnea f. sp. 'multigermtubi']|uniref:uncharacterized protein n=1 Tax=Drepanopeziza brunnea f. sp. 'multigermtubi' TaxID=698441 RepID=UPI00239A0BBD|nr:hypothetical protein L3040_007080 [Drepanopeziza brunnea f. sp. 'multigermtubi']